eukprot:GDKH01025669.1.p1 GENE.GDKH01025669.1~~GDKH01025669.1.p1  ORF type:complete len:212 (+),score=13.76 GDKH01025669.1:168-803(+)
MVKKSPDGPPPVVVVLVFGLLVVFWMMSTDALARGVAIFGALVFMGIETAWTTAFLSLLPLLDGRPPKFEMGHTTLAQFWGNVICLPVCLLYYHYFFRDPVWRICLFPLNIWALELVQGYFFLAFFGRNVAWHYVGWDALFNGNIRLAYAIPWMGLGVIIEVGFAPILLRCGEFFGAYWLIALATAALFTAVCYHVRPKWPYVTLPLGITV